MALSMSMAEAMGGWVGGWVADFDIFARFFYSIIMPGSTCFYRDLSQLVWVDTHRPAVLLLAVARRRSAHLFLRLSVVLDVVLVARKLYYTSRSVRQRIQKRLQLLRLDVF